MQSYSPGGANVPPYNTWFLGAHVSMPSTAARSVPPFLYESRFSDKRTHRQTDHATHWRNFTLKVVVTSGVARI